MSNKKIDLDKVAQIANELHIGNVMLSAYLIRVRGVKTIVLAENMADVYDKMNDVGVKDFDFVLHSSIEIVH